MLERARAGALVVRLKGGDPFVFGRGGEEALALRAAGIAFEVVPGITAGIAAAAYAGIPVTHRGLASAVALITAHEDPGKPEQALDWAALAAFPGTLVFYMGVRTLPALTARLIAAGRPAGEPAGDRRAGHAAASSGRCSRRWRRIADDGAAARRASARDHRDRRGRGAARAARLAARRAARAA